MNGCSIDLAPIDEYRGVPMEGILESSDGDLARAVAARQPGSAEAAEGELYRRFATRVRQLNANLRR